MKALVTGAGGFLGRHVVSALLARHVEVRAMVRPAARVEALHWPETVDVFRADLRAGTDLGPAFDGVDVLVHLAAAVGGGEHGQLIAAALGTERLLAAMQRSRCRRLVLASSFSVYDWSRARGTLDETAPLEGAPHLYQRDGYAVAKAWQEQIVRRAANQHGWDLTVLRPGFIWGRDHAYMAALGQRVGPIHVSIGPLTHIPMTYVENCADLFAVAATDSRASGETFNVVDGEGERVWSFLGEYLRRSGQRGLRIPVPYMPAYLTIRMAFETVFRRNTKLPGMLIPARFEARLKPLSYTNRRAHDVLGWSPPLDLHECLARTFPTNA